MKKIEQFEKVLKETVDKINNDREKYNIQRNDCPCENCGASNFIKLHRNTVGKITGGFSGYFGLFGGSISGYIDGKIETLPVLSCVKCKNERLVELYDREDEEEFFWREMPYFYFDFLKNGKKPKIDKLYLERPWETHQYMLDNENYDFHWYNELSQLSIRQWAKAGFAIKQKEIKFIGFKIKMWPSWKDLS